MAVTVWKQGYIYSGRKAVHVIRMLASSKYKPNFIASIINFTAALISLVYHHKIYTMAPNTDITAVIAA